MSTQTRASFGTLLRRYRHAAELTQEALAERAGLSARTIRLLEQDGSTPQRATAQRLVTALALAGAVAEQFLTATSIPQPRIAAPTYRPEPCSWPSPPMPLLGRGDEIAAVLVLLQQEQIRVLTLTGPGGVGKTRLALAVARQFQAHTGLEVVFVALAQLDVADLVLPTIARATDVLEDPSRPILASLSTALRDRSCLLVLDNFEHVAAAAPKVAALRAACPHLRLLVTSRVVLHVQGEQLFPVPPLPVAAAHHVPSLDELRHIPAVQLFIERAQASKPDFVLTPTNAEMVAQICSQLDGLPLAIELAATRVGILPLPALLQRLRGGPVGRSLQLLVGGARDLPERQRTVRDMIAWSYNLVPEAERAIFWRLGVFRGGWSLLAAEALCADLLPLDILEGLISLTEQSLLVVRDEDGEPRFGMLETIREYSLEQLEVHGKTEATRRAHATYYLGLAHEAEPKLFGADQLIWLERLDAEHDNLRAALHWFIDQRAAEAALRLSGALMRFWFMRGYWSEGRRWLEEALAIDTLRERDAVWTKALTSAGVLAHYQGDPGRATTLCGESLRLSRQLGDQPGIVAALHGLASVARAGDNYAAASVMYEESVGILRALHDPWGLAHALNYLGLSRSQEDPAAARPLIAEGLALFRTVGDRWGIGLSLTALSGVILLEGKFQEARAVLEEALTVLRDVGDKRGMSRPLWSLAEMARDEGEYALARRLYVEALAILCALGERVMTPLCLDSLAALAMQQGHPAGAARLFAVAAQLRDTSGAPTPAPLRAQREQHLADTRALLGEAQFAGAWAEGQTLTLEQAVAQVDRELDRRAVAVGSVDVVLRRAVAVGSVDVVLPANDKTTELTDREVEVLRLVAQGLTDSQVATRLIVSPRTISAHLASIYSKLGVNSRTAATRYALDHRLV